MQYRYPGARPFTDKDQDLFYGRDQDIADLSKLLLREKLSVLYARSGLGKSSLLQAGIVPRLRAEGEHEPYSFRFGTWQEGRETDPVKLTVARLELDEGAFYLDKLIPQENSLWYYCKQLQLQRKQSKLVWLFDQFEEIFSYEPEAVSRFGDQLSDILYQKIPSHFRDELERQPDKLTEEELNLLYEPLEVHALFSIRADRLSMLDQLSDILPAILHQRYELQALNRLQAEDAILNPAYSREPGFITPPFDYTDETLDYMLGYLTEGGTEDIESFQLQIICQYAEQQIENRGEGVAITVEDLGDLQDVFKNYYDNRISRLPSPQDQLAARKLIEEGLIFEEDERRLSLYEGQIERDFGVPSALLQSLVGTHLLRAEADPRGGFVYELSHDTLVAPILQAKQRRKAKEEEIRQEAERREQALLLAKERRKRRRALMLAIGGVGLALVALVAMGVAIYQSSRAEASRLEADKNRLAAVQSDSTAQLRAAEAVDARELAEERAQAAEIAQAEARAAEQETALQLDRLRAANYQRVAKKQEEAQALINELDLEQAATLLQEAMELGVNRKKSRDAYLELIFFYTEAGKAQKAYSLFQYLPESTATGSVDRDTISYLKSQLTTLMPQFRIKAIQAKYYPSLISVKGGVFNMGSAQDSLADAWPVHEVQISDFKLSETEVTVLQYYLYCTQTGQEMPNLPGQELQGNHPVAGVSWSDAKQYCEWLQAKLNRPIRLPTEAEWEYAAKGEGDEKESMAVAWYEGNSRGTTQPVGLRAPNTFGLYDLQGNVQEWCSDWYDGKYYRTSPLVNPPGPERGTRKILRGGSWDDTVGNISVTNRSKNIPDIHSDKNGFRVAGG